MPLRFPTKLVPVAREYDQSFLDELGRIDLYYTRAAWLIKTTKMISHGESREQRWHNAASFVSNNTNEMYHSDVRRTLGYTGKALQEISEKWRDDTSKKLNLHFTQQLEWFVNMKMGELLEQVKAMEDSRKYWVKQVETHNVTAVSNAKNNFEYYKHHVEVLMEKVKEEMNTFRACSYAWITAEKEFNTFVNDKLKDVGKPPPDAYYEQMFAWRKTEKSDKTLKRKQGVSAMLKTDNSSKSNRSNKSNKSEKSLGGKLKNKKETLKKKLGALRSMMSGTDAFKKAEKSKNSASKMGKADSKMGKADSKMGKADSKKGMVSEDSSKKKGKSAKGSAESAKGQPKPSEGSAE